MPEIVVTQSPHPIDVDVPDPICGSYNGDTKLGTKRKVKEYHGDRKSSLPIHCPSGKFDWCNTYA